MIKLGHTAVGLAVLVAAAAVGAPHDVGAVVFCARKKNAKVVTVRGTACKKGETSLPLPLETGPQGAAGRDGAAGVNPMSAARLPFLRARPTVAATLDEARTAAPKNVLLEKGPFRIYGKCFRATGSNEMAIGTYIETTTDGAVFDSRQDGLAGGVDSTAFLNADTAEVDREIALESVAPPPSASFANDDASDLSAVAADGTWLRGFTFQGASRGSLRYTGVYDSTEGCFWGGFVVAGP